MKKIVFVDIPMKEISIDKNRVCYAGTGNANCNYLRKVIFPINAIFAEKLKSDDSIKVVLLKTLSKENNSEKNTEIFKNELDEINTKIGAKIEYETIESDFVEDKKNNEKRLRAMLSKIEKNTEIYADITFGQKPLPMILMCVLGFSEKFFNADIKKIVYGKVDFIKHDDGIFYPENAELYDVTFLYYLNNLMAAMDAPNGEEALKNLDLFFAL